MRFDRLIATVTVAIVMCPGTLAGCQDFQYKRRRERMPKLRPVILQMVFEPTAIRSCPQKQSERFQP